MIRLDTAEIRRLNRCRISVENATRPAERAAGMQQPIQTSNFCRISVEFNSLKWIDMTAIRLTNRALET